MQFQFQNQDIKVFRVILDPASGRRQRLVLGTIDRRTLAVSETLKLHARSDELAQIDRWVDNQRRFNDLQAELAALRLPERMRHANRWLQGCELDAQTCLLIEDIRANWLHLRATLRQRELI